MQADTCAIMLIKRNEEVNSQGQVQSKSNKIEIKEANPGRPKQGRTLEWDRADFSPRDVFTAFPLDFLRQLICILETILTSF